MFLNGSNPIKFGYKYFLLIITWFKKQPGYYKYASIKPQAGLKAIVYLTPDWGPQGFWGSGENGYLFSGI